VSRSLVDEDNGVSGAAGIADLAAGVGRQGGAGGIGPRGIRNDGISAAGGIDVPGVAAKAGSADDGEMPVSAESGDRR